MTTASHMPHPTKPTWFCCNKACCPNSSMAYSVSTVMFVLAMLMKYIYCLVMFMFVSMATLRYLCIRSLYGNHPASFLALSTKQHLNNRISHI
jgi:hypothetical protein